MRLTIRPMTCGDLPSLHALLSDPEVMRYIEPVYTRERTEAFLARAGLSPDPLIYAVDDGDGAFIGYVIYHDYEADSKEIGWVLNRAVWGRGCAQALTEQLVRRAHAEGRDVVIECAPEQAATKRIAERNGFRRCGAAAGREVYRLEQVYRYETHLHTAPVSRCATASVGESLAFYEALGYDGVFITNHFLDGNINIAASLPYEERIRFYFSDYQAAKALEPQLNLKVFCGVETTFLGTDFLIYGLDMDWYLAHPQIMDMPKREELPLMMDSGALVIQAHPFREANYIDHIRLFPRSVHGVEVYNAGRTPFENRMAAQYARDYALLPFAGSDNHHAGAAKALGGMQTRAPLADEADFVRRVLAGEARCFRGTRHADGFDWQGVE